MIVNDLNLVSNHGKQTLFAAVLIGILGIIFIALSVLSIWHATHIKDDITPLEKRIILLKDRRESYLSTLKHAPTVADIEKLSSHIKRLSKGLNLRGLRVGKVFRVLETVVPDNAFLVEFEYPYEKSDVRFVLLSQSEKDMSDILMKMEHDERISKVVLSGQTRTDNQIHGVMADIRASIR